MPTMDTEKYSLRQRQKRKHLIKNSSFEATGYASDNSVESRDSNQYCGRLTKSPNNCNAGGGAKSKTKAAPLSKYRRKTANARERTRMREINQAFETLRTCVPPCITNEDSASTNEKLTKITTLRLAMKYIGILTEALANPQEADYDFLYDCTQPRDIVIENLEPVANVAQTKEKPSKTTKTSKNTKSAKSSSTATTTKARNKAATAKRCALSKKQKLTNTENLCQTTTIPCLNNYQESPASNASSAYASLSSASESSASPVSNSSYVFEQATNNHSYTYNQPRQQNYHNSISDLSNLMLESDGESLNLSERGLSPLQTAKSAAHSAGNEPYECSPTNMPTLENPLELSLRLMEPANDSLSLAVDPIIPPSSCISPLMNLESYNAFDLFHTEFNEQNALDLFLT